MGLNARDQVTGRATGFARRSALNEVVTGSIVICYRENVDQLAGILNHESLNPCIERAQYNNLELQYSSASRCFLGHRRAWEIASKRDGYTLVCEADFVPCKGIGGLPTFWPLNRELAWGYLYQGSPRLLWISPDGFLRGHTAPLVAYVINSAVAEIFLKFFDHELTQYRLEDYFTFDAQLQWWVMGRGAEAYIPMRHYGEHGGRANPEHKLHGLRRAGVHRADNLQAPLAFVPQYAGGSSLAFLKERLIARAYGWGRLLTGRWIIDTNVYSRGFSDTAKMYGVGVRRLSF